MRNELEMAKEKGQQLQPLVYNVVENFVDTSSLFVFDSNFCNCIYILRQLEKGITVLHRQLLIVSRRVTNGTKTSTT